MDTAATLALLLNRMIDGASCRPDHEMTSAILAEASVSASAISHRSRVRPTDKAAGWRWAA
jgi:hypothetical protein